MAYRRRRRGFERVGELPPNQLGLPLGRARELVLQRVWQEIAGEIIARQAPAERVRRGVLEIRLPDGPWGRILPDLLPQLAGRLAARHPALAVTGYRLLTGKSAAPEPSHAVPTVAEEPQAPAVRAPRAGPAAASGAPATPTAARLAQVMAGYLARDGRHRP